MNDTTNTTGEAGATTPQEEKTFTQDQVNAIVGERLAKEKSKAEATLASREQELAQREFLLTAKQTLTERGMPHELLDALNTSSPEAFEKALDLIQSEIDKGRTEARPLPSFAVKAGGTDRAGHNDTRAAFGLSR